MGDKINITEVEDLRELALKLARKGLRSERGGKKFVGSLDDLSRIERKIGKLRGEFKNGEHELI
jgi:hypothetical protein